jgi:copper chaperone CopZ
MKNKYSVTGMTCSGCVNTVQKLLKNVDGVREANVSLSDGIVEITQDREVPVEALKIALRGFPYAIVERAA